VWRDSAGLAGELLEQTPEIIQRAMHESPLLGRRRPVETALAVEHRQQQQPNSSIARCGADRLRHFDRDPAVTRVVQIVKFPTDVNPARSMSARARSATT
jgi:hypothetical protein